MATIEQIRNEIRRIATRTSSGNMERIHELEGMLPTAELDVWAYFGDWCPELLRDGAILCHCTRDTLVSFKACLPGPLGMWAGLPPHLPPELAAHVTATWTQESIAAAVFRQWANADNQLSLELRADGFMPWFNDMLFAPVSTSVGILQRCWPSGPPMSGEPRGALLPYLKQLKHASDILGGVLSYIGREPGYFVFVAGNGAPQVLHELLEHFAKKSIEFAFVRTEGDTAIWEGSRLSSYGSVI